MVEERKARLAKRKEERKIERRNKWLQEKEEAEQRARDEALKKGRIRFSGILEYYFHIFAVFFMY